MLCREIWEAMVDAASKVDKTAKEAVKHAEEKIVKTKEKVYNNWYKKTQS